MCIAPYSLGESEALISLCHLHTTPNSTVQFVQHCAVMGQAQHRVFPTMCHLHAPLNSRVVVAVVVRRL